jgi:hypothetical protein
MRPAAGVRFNVRSLEAANHSQDLFLCLVGPARVTQRDESDGRGGSAGCGPTLSGCDFLRCPYASWRSSTLPNCVCVRGLINGMPAGHRSAWSAYGEMREGRVDPHGPAGRVGEACSLAHAVRRRKRRPPACLGASNRKVRDHRRRRSPPGSSDPSGAVTLL